MKNWFSTKNNWAVKILYCINESKASQQMLEPLKSQVY